MNRYRKQLLFLCDSVILFVVALLLSQFIHRYNLGDAIGTGGFWPHLTMLYGCTTIFQLLFRNYDSLWRYAESREYLFLLFSALCGFGLYEVINHFILRGPTISFLLLTAIASLWVIGMLVLRFGYRAYRSRVMFRTGAKNQVPVAIVGAGSAGVQLLEELQADANRRYAVQCFFDDDPAKLHHRIHGVEVKGTLKDVPERLRAMDIHEIIVAIPSISEERRQSLLQEIASLERVRVTVLPNTMDLIEQKSIRSQLREVQIEDLLGRDAIQLNNKAVDAFLMGKRVMVTGGGGSIGSELCRQIAKHRPASLIIVDIYENNAYDIQQELRYEYGDTLELHVEIASIREENRVRQLFAQYKPQVVFHAAAHKHVPLMETSPQEAVRNNIFGTWNLVRAAEEFGVEKFIQISTDKAVNPTNIMGASKRMCEMILQSRKGQGGSTTFAAVRFGNVLGSNGSVVPLFKRQIAAGGPITITDKRIIRYFMTIPEAAQLVLLSGAMARQNELYVLDMGRPVKILDLAENLIRLSGLTPYRDIEIVETGLRPGEKLYEELLIAGNNIEKTENNQIFVERQPGITPKELEHKLEILREALKTDSSGAIRRAMHKVVPTFLDPDEVNKVQGDEVQLPNDPNEE